MFSFLEKFVFKYSNKVIGLDIFLENENIFFTYIAIKRTKGSLYIEETSDVLIDDFSVLKKNKLQNYPIVICINSRSIINKIQTSEVMVSIDNKNFAQIIPGFDPAKLYYQIIKKDAQVFFSLIRKEVLTNLVEKLNKSGFHIAHIVLGPYSLLNLEPIINFDTIVAQNYIVQISNNYSINIGKTEKTSIHKFGNDELTGNQMCSFGMAVGYFLRISNTTGNIEELVKPHSEEFKYFFLYRKFAVTALIFIFSLLLCNYLIFNIFSDKLTEAGVKMKMKNESIEEITKLTDDIRQKEIYLSENNLLYNTRLSFYADQIAFLVPKDMVLKELLIFPPNAEIKDNTEIFYNNNKILISGSSFPSSLNLFISSLKGKPWIKDIDINDYKNLERSERVIFTIDITIIRE